MRINKKIKPGALAPGTVTNGFEVTIESLE